MELIKEPLNVDFYFENRQMTEEDQKRVSAFIARQKGVKQGHVPVNVSRKNKRQSNEQHKKNELGVDIISDQKRQLTEEESKAISDYIKAKKLETSKLHPAPKKRLAKRVKIA